MKSRSDWEIQDQLLKIKEAAKQKHLVDLHACILADNTCTTTRRVQEHSVEPTHDLREFTAIIGAYHDVFAP